MKIYTVHLTLIFVICTDSSSPAGWYIHTLKAIQHDKTWVTSAQCSEGLHAIYIHICISSPFSCQTTLNTLRCNGQRNLAAKSFHFFCCFLFMFFWTFPSNFRQICLKQAKKRKINLNKTRKGARFFESRRRPLTLYESCANLFPRNTGIK